MLNKIAHLSYNDNQGGSALYAYRTHKFLNNSKKYISKMFVLNKNLNDTTIVKLNDRRLLKINKKLFFFFLNKKNKYSFYNYGNYAINKKSQISQLVNYNPKAIIIYNNSNFIHPKIIEYLSLKKIKIFFYLMDMEFVTGGCHYNFECKNFTRSCESCPAIKYPLKKIASNNLKEKEYYLKNIKVTFLSPNKLIYKIVKKSKIFNQRKHINKLLYLGLDLNKYYPNKKKINNYKITISFRSSLNPRKNISIFENFVKQGIKLDSNFFDKICFNIIGDNKIIETLIRYNISYKYFGNIKKEDDLINFYRSSDFFLNTSLADLGPVMINESLSCGVPVISTNNGVASDLIKDNRNGFKLKENTADSLLLIIKKIKKLKKEKIYWLKKKAKEIAEKKLDISKNINYFL